MLRGLIRFVLLAVSTFFAPATGPTYWQFHAQMDRRAWEIEQELSDDECNTAIKSVPGHFAYTQFFVQSGGNNSNSGSTSSNTPIYSNTFSWVGVGTNTLTVTDSGASVVAVNDYFNVGGSWVSQVTNVNASSAPTYVFTLSSTVIYGQTEPATNAAITATDGGAWASVLGIPTTTFTVPQSTQVCIKAGAALGGSQTLSMSGATTKPVWYRGYLTTVGDLEPGNAAWASGNNSSSTTYPTFAMTTHVFTNAGTFNHMSGLSWTSTYSGNAVILAGSVMSMDHCRIVDTTSTANTFALLCTGVATMWITNSYISMAGSSSTNGPISAGGTSRGFTMLGCTIVTTTINTIGINCGGNSLVNIAGCSFTGGATNYILTTTTGTSSSGYSIQGCTFNASGGDAIKFQMVPGSSENMGLTVADCYFYQSGGYNINQSTGTNTALATLAYNVNNQATSGHTNGFGDLWEIGASSAGTAAFSESLTPPFVSSTDLHLLSNSVGAGAGLPQQWENQASGLTSTPDVGAWQRAVSGGGGGGVSGARIFTGF